MKKTGLFVFIMLQLMIAVYSFSGVFIKMASRCRFMSIKFCLFYALAIGMLFVYAIGWQQVIKKVELTSAYSAKAAAVIWGLIWGMTIFHEKLTFLKVLGVMLVFSGLIVYFSGDREEDS
jgi:drug/metabolite transporter (DMT)-like permease